MPQNDNSIRDKDVQQASQLLQILAIIALAIIALADLMIKQSDVPSFIYAGLLSVAIGVDNVKKLFGGGR